MRFLTSVFFMNQFPQAPEYTIRAVSNIFENLRRYSKLKVHHWCRWHWQQMEKSSIRKIFIVLFGHLWVVELTNILIFAFKFTLRCLQPDIAHYLPPVSLTLVANLPPVSLIPVATCHPYQQHQLYLWQNLLPVLLIPVVHLALRITP